MSKNRFTYQGLIPRSKVLEVVFNEDVGGTHRLRSIEIPYAALLGEDITQAIDNVVRRQLIETWSGVDIADPLF